MTTSRNLEYNLYKNIDRHYKSSVLQAGILKA